MLVLVRSEGDESAARLIDLTEGHAPVHVTTNAPALLGVEQGALVILVRPGRWATWLNMHRPIVAERRLRVLLFCTTEDWGRLREGAPDFTDQVSHRIEVPRTTPPFLQRALDRARSSGELVAVIDPECVPAGWRSVDIAEGFAAVRRASAQGPTWVTGIGDGHDWLVARLAHARSKKGMALVDPAVFADEPIVAGRSAPWEQAIEALAAASVDAPGVEAARRELEPTSLRLSLEEPTRLDLDPRWSTLLGATSPPSAVHISLAIEVGLVDLTRVWMSEATDEVRREVAAGAQAARERGREVRAERAAALLDALDVALEDPESAIAELKGALAAEARRLGDPWVMGHVARQEGRAQVTLGQLDQALSVLEQASALFAKCGADVELASTLGLIGRLQHMLSGDALARETVENRLAPLLISPDAVVKAAALGASAEIFLGLGEAASALRLQRERVAIVEAMGTTAEHVDALGDLAEVLERLGERATAEQVHGERLVLVDAIDDPMQRADILGELAGLQAAQGRYPEALQFFQEQAHLYDDLNAGLKRAQSLKNQAFLHGEFQEIDEANRALQEAAEQFELEGDLADYGLSLHYLSENLMSQGKPREALYWIEREIAAFRQAGDMRLLAFGLQQQTWCLAAQGETAQALVAYEEFRKATLEVGDALALATAQLQIAPMLAESGAPRAALTLLHEAAAQFERAKDVRNQARALIQLGRVHRSVGDSERATAAWHDGLRLASTTGPVLIKDENGNPRQYLAEVGDPEASSIFSIAERTTEERRASSEHDAMPDDSNSTDDIEAD